MKKRFIIASLLGFALNFYLSVVFASAPFGQKAKYEKAALKTEASKVSSIDRAGMAKQAAILKAWQQCGQENAHLKRKIEVFEKENVMLKEQVGESLGVGQKAVEKEVSKAKLLSNSIDQIRFQLDMYTKAYQYLYNINNSHVKRRCSRPKLDAANALKEFKGLVAQCPDGKYVQSMNELVDGCPSLNNQTRLACLKNLEEIRDQLFCEQKKMVSDLNEIKKNDKKQQLLSKTEPVVQEPKQPEPKPAPQLAKPQEPEEDDDDDE